MRAVSSIVVLAATLAAPSVFAEPLSEVALYHRCYVRLTGQFPDYQVDEGLAQVRSGQRTAIEACMAVFDRATLVAQGADERPADNSEVGTAVLSTFQLLHSSWFLNREFPNNDDVSLGTESLYEVGEPAAYITRALFNPQIPASSILTAQEHLRVLREPVFPSLHEFGPNQFVFPNAPVLPVGPIIGVTRPGLLSRPYRFIYENEEGEEMIEENTLNIGQHFGGGFIGASSYLLLTVNETPDFVANGGRKMPRKWAKAVLQDALCRDLPVVRIEDAIPYVVADSQVPFRRQARCSQCHSTIDRMASTFRGVGYSVLFEDEKQGGIFVRVTPPSLPAEQGWPAVEDPEYAVRPTTGTLYFRDHNGQLVDLPLDGPAQLGARLAELDGPYICLAQRYYRFFTGIEAYIGDPQNFAAEAGSRDAYYRDRVIELGRQLRASGDLRDLIEAILRSPDYRESDFGVSR